MLLNNAARFVATSYDILVLGGGTAGATIAAELSKSDLTVGVIEAGPSRLNDPLVYTPGYFGHALTNPDYDWTYLTTPQPDVNNREVVMSAGKMLGGSSGLNLMAWTSGAKSEYDAWEKLGNPGWGADDFLPYIRKAERIQDLILEEQQTRAPEPPYNETLHGRKGSVKVGFPLWVTKAAATVIETFHSLGVRWNKDPFGGDNGGVIYALTSVDQRTARRSYADPAYVVPALERKNFHVLTTATVGKIILDKHKRAVGVEFYDAGKKKYTANLKVGGEVIVSAGSLGSPKILELSGIGNKKVLKKAGIPVQVESEFVGENLQDHLLGGNTYEFKAGEITTDLLYTDPVFKAKAEALYNRGERGILSSAYLSQLAMLPLRNITTPDKLKSMISRFGKRCSSPLQDPYLSSALPRSDTDCTPQVEILFAPFKFIQNFRTALNTTYLTMISGLMHPLSRGNTHVTSPDPFARSTINPSFLSHPYDRELMIAGHRYADKVAQTAPLSGRVHKRVSPAKEGQLTDDEWLEHIRETVETLKHPIGSCAMAPKSKGGVVDCRLRVYGAKGVRVVDASIMPLHISAHTQATVYGIAHKAARMVKKDFEVYSKKEERPWGH